MKKSLCIIFLFIGISLSAQDISLKTNLLYDISTTFNLGAEFRLAPKWTLDVFLWWKMHNTFMSVLY